MSTFRAWLARQRERNDPVGDIARDAAIDACSSGDGPVEMRDHIERAHSMSDGADEAFDRAADEWRSSGRAVDDTPTDA